MHLVSLGIGGPYPSFYSDTTCLAFVSTIPEGAAADVLRAPLLLRLVSLRRRGRPLPPLFGGGRREDCDGAQVAGRLLQERHVLRQTHRLVPVGGADGAQLQEGFSV